MRVVLAVASVVLMSACSSMGGNIDPEEAQKREFMSQMVIKKFSENGENLLCDQPGYQDCYNMSRAQCIHEMGEFKDACLEKAKSVAGSVYEKKHIDKFAKSYMMCMATKHVLQHSSEMEEIASCMKKAKFEKGIAKDSFMR